MSFEVVSFKPCSHFTSANVSSGVHIFIVFRSVATSRFQLFPRKKKESSSLLVVETNPLIPPSFLRSYRKRKRTVAGRLNSILPRKHRFKRSVQPQARPARFLFVYPINSQLRITKRSSYSLVSVFYSTPRAGERWLRFKFVLSGKRGLSGRTRVKGVFLAHFPASDVTFSPRVKR